MKKGQVQKKPGNAKNSALLIISVAILILAVSVGTYYIFFLPNYQTERIELEKKKYENELAEAATEKKMAEEESRKAKEEAEEEIASKAAADEINRINLTICLRNSDVHYNKLWDKNCASNAKRRRAYNASASLQFMLPELPEKDCSLPTELADSVNESHEKEKEECYRKLQLGLFPTDETIYSESFSNYTDDTIISSIKFNQFAYEQASHGYYMLTGNVSRDCEKITVTAYNDEVTIDETPWELTGFNPGDSSFSYFISSSFESSTANAAVGNNIYTATAFCDGGIVSDSIEVYFNESYL